MALLDEFIDQAIEKVGKDLSPQAKEAYAKALKHKLEKGGTTAEAFALDEGNLEWIYSRAYNLYQAGRYEDARVYFNFLIKLDDSKFKYYLGLGACYYMQGQYDTAVFSYILATLRDASNPIPYHYISECFLKLGDRKSALETYEVMLILLENNNAFAEMRERVKLSAEQLRKELAAETETAAIVKKEINTARS